MRRGILPVALTSGAVRPIISTICGNPRPEPYQPGEAARVERLPVKFPGNSRLVFPARFRPNRVDHIESYRQLRSPSSRTSQMTVSAFGNFTACRRDSHSTLRNPHGSHATRAELRRRIAQDARFPCRGARRQHLPTCICFYQLDEIQAAGIELSGPPRILGDRESVDDRQQRICGR